MRSAPASATEGPTAGRDAQLRSNAFRVAVLLACASAHLILLALFPEYRVTAPRRTAGERSSLVVLIPSREPEVLPEPVGPSTSEPVLQRLTAPVPQDRARDEPAADDEPVDSEPITIDWAGEAERAAARQIEQLEQQRRIQEGFTPRGDPIDEGSVPTAPQFGWYEARTKRITPIEGGGTLIRLNDRCVVAIVVIPMPMCSLGKIEARGDLFEPMREPPEMGDWKDR